MQEAKAIRLVILDADGVMTDGRVLIDDHGVQQRSFDIKDGLGIVALQFSGIEVAIITARQSPAVAIRARELQIARLHQGAANKAEVYETIRTQMGITDGEVCYVGDDLVDLGVMKRAGFAVAPADAAPEVREQAHYVTRATGGHGAVREVAELILKAQGKWASLLEKLGRT